MSRIGLSVVRVLWVGVALSGCSTLPGGVGVSQSSYDGSKEVVMQPGWAGNLKIGFTKTSKMPKDQVRMVVRHDAIVFFQTPGPNFFVKIDGKEESFAPETSQTECDITSSSDVGHCSQRYMVKQSLVERIFASKNVKLKLHLTGASYVEGNVDQDGMTTARDGIKDFLAALKKEGL